LLFKIIITVYALTIKTTEKDNKRRP